MVCKLSGSVTRRRVIRVSNESGEQGHTTITTTVCMLAMSAGAGDTEGLVSDMRPSAPGPGHTALEAANEPDTECHTRDPRSSAAAAVGLGISVYRKCAEISVSTYLWISFLVDALATTYEN